MQLQIDELKTKILNEEVIDGDSDLDLIVLKFLEQYNKWAFSALRIKKWGSEQSGFEELGRYSSQQIRQSLRRLLSKDNITTKISSKGNTIYRIK